MTQAELYEMIKKEGAYLWNDLEEAYVKIGKEGKGCFAKFMGQKEYSVSFTSNMVKQAVLQGNVVPRSEYEKA